jgi:hypothetical protein
MTSPLDRAAQLNRDCDCVTTDLATLQRGLALSAESHAQLFSEAPVFIEREHLIEMERLIRAVHAVVQLDGFRSAVLADAPEIARTPSTVAGVFTGFDFHISLDGPKLIEINTNAGGALLNAAARRAQVPCCPGSGEPVALDVPAFEAQLIAMFRREWRLARGTHSPLRSIAIVDDQPERQFLHPEFVLFQRLFAAHGIEASIADPRELAVVGSGLEHHGRRIDLVYNRLTDFYFEAPEHAALQRAYTQNLAVITPDPHAHALLANKNNLALLTDAHFLQSIAVQSVDVETLLRAIPRTRIVNGAGNAWWADRKAWFFKPARGYGSRGTYRGDKMTRRVFTEIMQGGYVAQALSPPAERRRATPTGHQSFKTDIRAYVYDGELQLIAARVYQGQTTNFRTVGGGFATVHEVGAGCQSQPANRGSTKANVAPATKDPSAIT